MKHKILFCLALILGAALVGGASPLRPELPAFNIPTKLELAGSWSNVTVKLIVPGTSNPPVKCRVEEVPARIAVYTVVPPPPSPYWNQFSVLAVHDPHTKRNCLLRANPAYCLSDPAGMVGYVFLKQGIHWIPPYLEISDAEGDLDAAIARFEKEFDGRKLNDALLVEHHTSVDLQKASPLFYFQEKPVGGAAAVALTVEGFEITDNIIRLDARNPVTKVPASYWIDLKLKTVVKSTVGGHRMIFVANQPWADPAN
jgi:hypothetical protein